MILRLETSVLRVIQLMLMTEMSCSTLPFIRFYLYPTPRIRVNAEKLTVSHLLKKFPLLMEPGTSLPHSQAHANCTYLQPDQSSPCLPISSHEDPFLILSSHLRLGLPMISSQQVSPPKSCMHFSCLTYVSYASIILICFMLRRE